MSGHSKWSQIKRQKGANDAKRGALFTKLTREIITAARQGGGDTDANYRLRMAVDKARANSMPADNIKRAIERATGGGADAEQFEEITYEGIGPASVAVIVAAMTDNRNRTASEVRSIFTRHGGTLSTVAWQFVQRGVISIPLNGRDPDEITLAAIDAGAADVSAPDAGSIVVTTEPADLEAIRRTPCRMRDSRRSRPSCRWSRRRRSRSAIRRPRGRCSSSSSSSRTSTTSRTSTPTSTSPAS